MSLRFLPEEVKRGHQKVPDMKHSAHSGGSVGSVNQRFLNRNCRGRGCAEAWVSTKSLLTLHAGNKDKGRKSKIFHFCSEKSKACSDDRYMSVENISQLHGSYDIILCPVSWTLRAEEIKRGRSMEWSEQRSFVKAPGRWIGIMS